jgi:hypothetical protein
MQPSLQDTDVVRTSGTIDRVHSSASLRTSPLRSAWDRGLALCTNCRSAVEPSCRLAQRAHTWTAVCMLVSLGRWQSATLGGWPAAGAHNHPLCASQSEISESVIQRNTFERGSSAPPRGARQSYTYTDRWVLINSSRTAFLGPRVMERHTNAAPATRS